MCINGIESELLKIFFRYYIFTTLMNNKLQELSKEILLKTPISYLMRLELLTLKIRILYIKFL